MQQEQTLLLPLSFEYLVFDVLVARGATVKDISLLRADGLEVICDVNTLRRRAPCSELLPVRNGTASSTTYNVDGRYVWQDQTAVGGDGSELGGECDVYSCGALASEDSLATRNYRTRVLRKPADLGVADELSHLLSESSSRGDLEAS